jgi:serine/threonine protein kinase
VWVDHPNVIKLHEIGHDDGLVFLVLELVHGRTLAEYVREWHDWRDIVGVFIQAAHGLAAIHEAGLVHGDVKPDNILIGSNGRVLIADLGRARTLDAVDGRDGGAVTYMAPERIAGAASSTAADQFGLCTVLWQALYAVRPWSMNSAELVRSTEPERALLRTDVPRSLVRVIRRGLAVTSRDRFENMDALATALTDVLIDARRREDRRRAAAAGISAALVIAAFAWLVTRLL